MERERELSECELIKFGLKKVINGSKVLSALQAPTALLGHKIRISVRVFQFDLKPELDLRPTGVCARKPDASHMFRNEKRTAFSGIVKNLIEKVDQSQRERHNGF